MKTKSNLLAVLAVLLLAATSCQKNNDKQLTQPTTQIKLTNVLFKSSQTLNTALVPDTYDERGCIVDNKVGTHCFVSTGNSCSSPHNCSPVTAMASSGLYTKQEIDRSIAITNKAYSVQYVY